MKQWKVGIIGAMAVEVASLKEAMGVTTSTSVAGMEFFEGSIGGVDVVLARSGIGKVNAAICTQIMIDRFGVTHMMNTGIAGSLDNEINIGDVVVSTDTVYHDMDAEAFGYARGQVPQMDTFSFPADEEFRSIIIQAVKQTAPEINTFEGRVASGDCFVSDDALKQNIIKDFGAKCVEMEGCAIGHTAWVNKIPFVIVRFISDKADDEGGKTYSEFETEAADHSALIVRDALAIIGERLAAE